MTDNIVGGIEGGASHSNAILLNASGEIIASAKGLGTNHLLIGFKECQRRIAEMINSAKKDAGISEDEPLETLGLSLSGCELEATNQKLVQGLRESYPNLSKNYKCGSDTEGSVAATSNNGGIVCIAGTGSNTLLINPDGTRVQCGGWGYIIGDEGSAWKITYRAIKYCFDDIDNFEQPPHPTERVWNLVKSFFKVECQADMMDMLYKEFEKPHLASLCKNLSELARDGDELSKHIFYEAGLHLAKSIGAVLTKAAPELLNRCGGVHILCVGSVWLSWDLLEPGFIDYLNKHSIVQTMSLMRLTTTSAVGAALMASDDLNLPIKRDYKKNYNVFYQYKKGGVNSAVNCLL